MNYTPGPWKLVESNSARTFNQMSIRPVNPVLKGMVLTLAKVERADLSEYGGGNGLANARLIAAAPDLLAALQELRYACTDKAEAMADAAIARAVGAP